MQIDELLQIANGIYDDKENVIRLLKKFTKISKVIEDQIGAGDGINGLNFSANYAFAVYALGVLEGRMLERCEKQEAEEPVTPQNCKLCGGEPELIEAHLDKYKKYRVACTDCRMSGPEFVSAKQAIHEWNRLTAMLTVKEEQL
jgi:hypothetical protein